MKTVIEPSSWPRYAQDEIAAVQRVLETGRVNYWNGEEGRAFEREFAAYHGVPFGVAVANGSVALELALRVLDVGPGDEVVVTPRTFIASASSILLVGARPIFADVDSESQNITPETVRRVLTNRTKAVITVHFSGWPCDMPGFRDLADESGVKLVEDCAQAHGARLNGELVGSFGDAAAFSFCTDKIMSTGGEGGMVLFRDESLWRRAWSYKDHGKDWDLAHSDAHPPGFRWLHRSFGTNWRLTNMQAAIGRVQLGKLSDWVARRRENASAIANGLNQSNGLRVIEPPPDVMHSYYRYYVFLNPDMMLGGWNRDRVVETLQSRGVRCMHGGCSEVYLEEAFDDSGLRPRSALPVARRLGETSIAFLVDPTISANEARRMGEVASEVIAEATQGAS